MALIEGVLVMLATILLGIILRKLNILHKDHSLTFSKLVLKVTLPALIFSSLAVTKFHTEYLSMAGIMAVVEIICMALAWSVARMIRLKRDETGALILVSAFGMSTMLGYPLISQLFPGVAQAMEEAVITSEFGVGFLLFIFGPMIAMYFGNSEIIGKDLAKSAYHFFISPVFISLVLGIGMSFVKLNLTGQVFQTIDHFLKILAAGNSLLVCFAVGLIIEVEPTRKYIWFLLIAIGLKLILKPVIAYWMTSNPSFTPMMREIIFIETAMPSALLGAVFARHYNCKPELVSTTVVITLVLSIITVSLLFLVFF